MGGVFHETSVSLILSKYTCSKFLTCFVEKSSHKMYASLDFGKSGRPHLVVFCTF